MVLGAPSSTVLFSVKSINAVVRSLRGRASPFSSKTWHKLWSLKLQARLKHLLWKIARNILPTRDNIGCIFASQDIEAWECPCCKFSQETLSHIFLECDLACFFWNSSPWLINIVGFSSKRISEWIYDVLFPKGKAGHSY